ncbi:MAG TPA: alpha/beta hydrolase [Chitinophagaceae bacterium]|jgi:sigma-B regulation protein RsbQ|nr:alpha/beta hydrolase [Chitinophagaceae bacterium]
MKTNIIQCHNVNVSGKGSQPIMFAHGLACDQNVWRLVAPSFEDDYKVVLFDYVGCGKSDRSNYRKEKYSTLNGYAEDVIAICEALALNDVIFVGHSVSSMIGIHASLKRNGMFSRLIMVGPSPKYINEKDYLGGFTREEIEQLLHVMKHDYEKWAGYFAPIAMGNSERPELSEGLKTNFCMADPDITYDFAEATFLSDSRQELEQLKIPSLILQISNDIVAPQQVGEYMHKKMPGSELYQMEATGHFPHLSSPEETIRLIKQYLEKHSS